MSDAGPVIDRLRVIQYPTTCTCVGTQCCGTYDQRLRVRRSCINEFSAGAYVLSGTPIVSVPGVAYTVGDYLQIDGGGPIGQPIILRVVSVAFGGPFGPIATVEVASSGNYSTPPPPIASSTAKSGNGVGATFSVTFVRNGCIACK
jgi:hypothetical protein